MKRIVALALVLVLPAFLLAAKEGREKAQPAGPSGEAEAAAPMKAIAVVHSLAQGNVHGQVVFTQHGNMVEVSGEVTGLTPGEHGFHVHEFGDLSSSDGMSTGGHYNPTNMPHACPASDKRHEGDLGNIKANEEGRATIRLEDSQLKLSGPHSIIGRALIVHAKADDCHSQPSGEAGGRIAGGVIGVAKH